MAKLSEPEKVRCRVCEKEINLSQKRRCKKINGSGKTVISGARKLRDGTGRYVCSDVCFNLAVNLPSEPVSLGPD